MTKNDGRPAAMGETPADTDATAGVVETIFSTRAKPFPCPVDGKIETVQFLEGASGVVSLVEKLGKVFAPVRYDMNGNIEKLTSKYNEDQERFEFLNEMLICEQAQGALRATDALLWLRRALSFFHKFLFSVVEDAKAGRKREDLSDNIQKAYRETLQKYHGFLAQRLFSVLSKMVPHRSQLLKIFALGVEDLEDAVIPEVEKFLSNLNSNLVVLDKFYEDLRLTPL